MFSRDGQQEDEHTEKEPHPGFKSKYGVRERGGNGSGCGEEKGTSLILQPIMPLDLPVRVRSWELTVYPCSYTRRCLGVTRSAQARM